MPRQRKPQSGAQRIGTWRVANTTTGSTTTQAVYRIPTWNRRECDVRNFEVTWTSPIAVAIEWENVYRISLDVAALENAIEGMNLDLSNVTLQTVNWDVTFTGNITAEWEFTWTTINATTWNITNIVSNSITADAISTDDLSTDWLTVTNNATIGGTLWVTWATTLWSTLSVDDVILANSDVTIAWTTTTNSIVANSWNISDLTSTSISTWTLDASTSISTDWTLDVTWASTLWEVSATNISASWNVSAGGDLAVTWASTFTGNITAWNVSAEDISVDDLTVAGNSTITGTQTINWATIINDSLTVTWATNLWGNVSTTGNLSVAGNSTVTGTQTVTGDSIFSGNVSVTENLTVAGDATVTDDLTVNGTTHLKGLETDWSVDIDGTLRVTWAINGLNWLTVTGQVESDTVRTGEVIADEARVSGGLYLSQWAEAPDFVLQSEKGQPNWVAPLDVNGKIDNSYLPPVYTSAIVKMWVGVFSNSDTSVVVDADIKADSFVIISNYQDITWDLNETINVWQLTVVSNQIETWSYKYIVVNALS